MGTLVIQIWNVAMHVLHQNFCYFKNATAYHMGYYYYCASPSSTNKQCDQIGQFIELWATFQSLCQQLFCLYFKAIFVTVSKSFIFSSEIIIGQLLYTFGDFLLVTLQYLAPYSPRKSLT